MINILQASWRSHLAELCHFLSLLCSCLCSLSTLVLDISSELLNKPSPTAPFHQLLLSTKQRHQTIFLCSFPFIRFDDRSVCPVTFLENSIVGRVSFSLEQTWIAGIHFVWNSLSNYYILLLYLSSLWRDVDISVHVYHRYSFISSLRSTFFQQLVLCSNEFHSYLPYLHIRWDIKYQY